MCTYLCFVVTSPRPEITPSSKESTEHSTEESTESAEVSNEKSFREKPIKADLTTTPKAEPLYVKGAKVSNDGKEEPNTDVEGTIELSKTHQNTYTSRSIRYAYVAF